jgi:hypothetical protein
MKKMILVGVLSAMFGAVAMHAFAGEPQPHMKAARKHLEQALEQLDKATADKGGHRVKAIALVKEAIEEVRAGTEHDNTH